MKRIGKLWHTTTMMCSIGYDDDLTQRIITVKPEEIDAIRKCRHELIKPWKQFDEPWIMLGRWTESSGMAKDEKRLINSFVYMNYSDTAELKDGNFSLHDFHTVNRYNEKVCEIFKKIDEECKVGRHNETLCKPVADSLLVLCELKELTDKFIERIGPLAHPLWRTNFKDDAILTTASSRYQCRGRCLSFFK